MLRRSVFLCCCVNSALLFGADTCGSHNGARREVGSRGRKPPSNLSSATIYNFAQWEMLRAGVEGRVKGGRGERQGEWRVKEGRMEGEEGKQQGIGRQRREGRSEWKAMKKREKRQGGV